jgi:hypothetical protein
VADVKLYTASESVNSWINGTLGTDFIPKQDVTVTALGVYATGTLTGAIHLWRVSDQVKLASTASLTVSSNTIGFGSITPVKLLSGVAYIIAHGSSGSALGSATRPSLPTDVTAGGAVFTITANNTRYVGSTDTYPSNIDLSGKLVTMLLRFDTKTKIGTIKAQKGDGTIITLPVYDPTTGVTSQALRTYLANGKIGCLDLVGTGDATASPFRIYHGGAIKAIQKE